MWALRTDPEEADLSSEGSESENEIPVMSSSGDLMTLKLQGFGSNGDELGQGSHRRFHGKACMLQEIVATRMAKEKHFSQAGADGIDPQLRELLGNAMGPGKVAKETRRRPEFWTTPPVSPRDLHATVLNETDFLFSGSSSGKVSKPTPPPSSQLSLRSSRPPTSHLR
jgi:hypothetical protein